MQPTVIITDVQDTPVDRTRVTRMTDSLRVEYTLGAIGRAELEVRDYDSFDTAYRPLVNGVVEILAGATRLFRGSTIRTSDAPLGAPGVGTVTTVEAQAISTNANRLVIEKYASGFTLKQVVSDVFAKYLAPYQILTLDPAMADGPTLGELTFDYARVEEVFNTLVDLTGWVYRVTPADVIQWFQIGTKVRSLVFSAANDNILGAIEWSRDHTAYFNRVFVRYGTSGVINKTDTFWGDGVTNKFGCSYPVARPIAVQYVGGVYGAPGVGYGYEGVGPGWPWSFDASDNTLNRTIGAAIPGGIVTGPMPTGDAANFNYDVNFPVVRVVEHTDEVNYFGPSEMLVDAPEIFVAAEAEALGQSLLRKFVAGPRTVTFKTRALLDLLPGDTVYLDVPSRTLPYAEWMVIGVMLKVDPDQELTATLTLLEGQQPQDTWLDYWRGTGGVSGSSGTASGSVMPGPSGDATPISALPPPFYLGAAEVDWRRVNPVAWVPASGVQVYIQGRTTGTVTVRLRARSGSVRARLYDLTAGADVGNTGPITGTTFTALTFVVTLTEGHYYELQVLPSLPDVDVQAVSGYLV